MIEFAPNPSGPAHLGTLRSYAVAYLEARRTGQPLFLRFDAWDKWKWLSPDWAQAFLRELAALEMTPDHWQYCTDAPLLSSLPEWAVCFPPLPPSNDKLVETWGYFPETTDASIPDSREEMWRIGEREMPRLRVQTDASKNAPDPYTTFAVWDVKAQQFRVWGYVASLIHMSLCGATTIVRAHPLFYLRLFHETFAQKWFGFRLPKVLYAAVVANENGGLKKSALQPGEPGTVGWALAAFGAGRVRECVLRSAREEARPIIAVRDILC